MMGLIISTLKTALSIKLADGIVSWYLIDTCYLGLVTMISYTSPVPYPTALHIVGAQ